MLEKLNLKTAYSRYVAGVKSKMPSDEQAMAYAIGGNFHAFGVIERELLKFYGLPEDGYLVDVGCGSGRLAIPIAQWTRLRYLGTDVVKDLVDFARVRAARSDWRFAEVNGFEIPEADNRADMVCFFSVLTHLLHEQTYIYLEEARRVLKSGGKIVFSFLEFALTSHWDAFAATVKDARLSNAHPLNVFISRDAIKVWASHLKLDILDIRNGDEPFVPLPHKLTLDDGQVLKEFGHLGQSICVLRKPAS